MAYTEHSKDSSDVWNTDGERLGWVLREHSGVPWIAVLNAPVMTHRSRMTMEIGLAVKRTKCR
jgi:hypothetical protein